MPFDVPKDADGFIVDQAGTAPIPYGRRASSYSGCGWIAAHNLLVALGRAPDAALLASQLSRGWFRGRLGTGPLRLRRFLRAQGVPLKTAFTFRAGARLAQNAGAGILLYAHRRGLHYVAFVGGAGAKKQFLNVGPGQPALTATLEAFREQHAISPFCCLLVSLC